MTDYVTRIFTFGTSHMSSYPLPLGGGRLADYWVEVSLPKDYDIPHRLIFIEHFANRYLPDPMQWAFEYLEQEHKPQYFPGGCLCRITQDGIEKE